MLDSEFTRRLLVYGDRAGRCAVRRLDETAQAAEESCGGSKGKIGLQIKKLSDRHIIRRFATQKKKKKRGSDMEGKVRTKKECIIRESNTGLIDGNDEFYH